MNVNIKLLEKEAKLPKYATDGSGCFDIFTTTSDYVYPNMSKVFNTGISIEVPVGHVLLVYSRSGHGFKDDVRLCNCVGVIDSDYRGELKIKLSSDSSHKLRYFSSGDAIAQGMIIPIEKVQFNVVDALSETKRGEGGFGSTDVSVS